MARSRFIKTGTALLSVVAIASACGNGGTGPALLTFAEVGAVYDVCSLQFQPQQTLLPAVDIRGAAMDTTPEPARRPWLTVNNATNEFELEYFSPGQLLRRRIAGVYQPGSSSVHFTFNPSPALSALLLPPTLEANFQANPSRLTFSRSGHDVPRQAYVALAEIEPEGLADPIRGTISGHFQAGGCP
jgi:hypothetical protein